MQQTLPLMVLDANANKRLNSLFHPAVESWFSSSFDAATAVQRDSWAVTTRRQCALIAAPTGSGKTLAAFLGAINDLVVSGLSGGLADEVYVLYVSPLKALSNDIQKNLQAPLLGIRQRLVELGYPDLLIRDAVRTGDTSALERSQMRRKPPHILVTTPESLFILLSSDSGRVMLASTRSIIVDELHAVAGSKRGCHLALSLERLDSLCDSSPVRIGLSATQKPIETMAKLLMGGKQSTCRIIDSGHTRDRDIAIEMPRSPLTAVMATEVWSELYDRLAELVQAHRTTLVFVNQRRMAERVAHHLAERIGDEVVTAHHGSLAKEHRLHAEQRLKGGSLRALVATASLELGIDIGDVDLVVQLGSPRSINAFLQRVGRSGHAIGRIPKGRLFPLSLDDLVESTALIDSVRRAELDRIAVIEQPLDVLSQQVVAEVACQEWGLDALYAVCRRAFPYRELSVESFEGMVRMLAEGYATHRGRRGALLHYDAVNRVLRARRGARLVAVTNAGTIPDQFDYDVVLAPDDLRIGTLNEDFAFESLPGDIVQLGNTSYRILKVETGRVYVEDAKGQPPNMPFWFGEAPGRSDELSCAVSRLRENVQAVFNGGDKVERQNDPRISPVIRAVDLLQREYGLDATCARQLADYLFAASSALGLLPTRHRIVFERFFDEVGDTHLVIHSPFGSRINRAWGLALRKRFCRQFNFELQAAALDDSLVLSLGPIRSFPLEEVKRYLNAETAREVLVQAILQAPMFPTRWRWAASIALAVIRNRHGKRVPPQFQRSDAEDLLTQAFPDAVACQDNLTGSREVPDHPLVKQALNDCLTEVMDVEGFLELLRLIESDKIDIICRDLSAPSPLSESILNARPYAFLDDGAAEERRTNAVQTGSVANLVLVDGTVVLEADAVARVQAELMPHPANADELHDALIVNGFLTDSEVRAHVGYLEPLLLSRRIARLIQSERTPEPLWVAAERFGELRLLLPQAEVRGNVPRLAAPDNPDSALLELIRSRLEISGPTTAEELAQPLGFPPARIEQSLVELEQQGCVMRGQFLGRGVEEWCERRRLARIHRYIRERKRAEVEPVSAAAMMRFLIDWHGIGEDARRQGPLALTAVLEQLEGFPVAAQAWESEILPSRMRVYDPGWLDQLCASGSLVWQRLPRRDTEHKAVPVRTTPIVLIARDHVAYWQTACHDQIRLSGTANRVLDVLRERGASFFVELVLQTGLLRSQVEQALGELVSQGLCSADGFSGLRALIAPAEVKARRLRRGGLRAAFQGVDSAGRWSFVQRASPRADGDYLTERNEFIARVLLRRYGVVFRRLVDREANLPPWRDLFYVYRRLEARGEILGGRFVNGFAGEQFASKEAAVQLRRHRENSTDACVVINATDPLNLTGGVLPGERVPSSPGNRVLLRGGSAAANLVSGKMRFEVDAPAVSRTAWQRRLQMQ